MVKEQKNMKIPTELLPRCPVCGAPMVIVTTNRGPWKLCPNFDCPGKEKDDAKKSSERGRGGARRGGAKRTTRKKA